MDRLLSRARGLWEELAGVPVSFDRLGGVSVVVSPGSRMCPPGWVGVVTLGGSAIATAPSESAAAMVGDALSDLAVDAMGDAAAIGSVLHVAEVLGPAALGYLCEGEFRRASIGSLDVQQLPADHPELRELEQSAGADDADESGLGEITSPAFIVRAGGKVVAASGYRVWPHQTAHLSVLTTPGRRGQGLGRAAASSAVAHALSAGLLPQWRARPIESRHVAAALGFRELGTQLSIRLR